ncbi:MAG TPA: O-antigen ligase family protein [Ignavibacteriaceae bacterium]
MIITKFIALLYVSMIISTFFSEYFYSGVEQIIKQSVFFIIVYIIYSFMDRIKYIKTVLAALTFAAIVITISILSEYLSTGFNVVDTAVGKEIRMTGILSNINAAGSFYGALFPILLSLAGIIKVSKYKILLYVLNIFLFCGIIFTTSRSAYLGILAGTLFVFYILNKKLFVKFIIILGTAILIVFITPSLNNFFSIFLRFESGVSQRDHLWALSIHMIKDHPFFGIGPGAYSYEMLNYFPVLLNTWVGQQLIILRDVTFGANNSHNFFLFFASDMGVLGLITAILLPVTFVRSGMIAMRKFRNHDTKFYTLTVGIMAAGLGLFVRGIFEGIGLLTYGWITMDLPFWIIFTILISLNHYDHKLVNVNNHFSEFAGRKI